MSTTADLLVTREAELLGGWIPQRPIASVIRGEGVWLIDAAGRRYLDFTSGYGTAPLGHAHPALTAAIAKQAALLLACPTLFPCAVRARFLEELSAAVGLPHLFLCNSGTEAIEAGLKFARLATGRTGVVALQGSFHGRTAGALSVTGNPLVRRPFEPLLAGVTFVPRDDPAALAAAVDDNVGLVVVEPVQGEGGVHPIDPEFLRAARRVTRECGALLLVDEIQTGFGRIGDWFAFAELGLEPDLVALGKGIAGGLPMGALAYTRAVAAALFPGVHGSTFGGNPLACAAGLATLGVLRDQRLPERAREVGGRLLERLRRELAGKTLVRDIRGRGLMVGVELRRKAGAFLHALTTEHGVLALPAGPNVIRLLPPLTIGDDEIGIAVRGLEAVLRE